MKNRLFKALLTAVLLYLPLCAHAGGTPDTVHSEQEQLDTVWVRQHHQKTIYAIAFSPDGRLIASSSADKTIKLVATETGELVRTIPTAPYQGSLAFSPDGRYLASGKKFPAPPVTGAQSPDLRLLKRIAILQLFL